MKEIQRYVLGMVQVNTYVLWNDNHVLIIDPGSKSKKLQSVLDEAGAIVDGIFLTHAHFDHIGGVDAFAKKYNAPLYMNELDAPLLSDPRLNLSGYDPLVVLTKPNFLMPGKQKIGTFEVTIYDAPGHSEGCSMLEWENNLFSGDVLFQGSIGRTDFYTSSNTKMMQSLKRIKEMNPDLVVYPGHGEATTIKNELQWNPFLQY
ncbi:MAG: MBL fold metallo-hydrolase [Longicatena sp.]|jgi:glyoxylase-like metal-dependent hydrolase (beta-lactamase superfamily II)|nr:MBL fold metallo-hydrolase [Longicatena sp.]